MDLDTYKAKIAYEALPTWRKFIHGYLFTIRTTGIGAIVGYPLTLWKLKKMVKKYEKDEL